jgi:hypothetical protein
MAYAFYRSQRFKFRGDRIARLLPARRFCTKCKISIAINYTNLRTTGHTTTKVTPIAMLVTLAPHIWGWSMLCSAICIARKPKQGLNQQTSVYVQLISYRIERGHVLTEIERRRSWRRGQDRSRPLGMMNGSWRRTLKESRKGKRLMTVGNFSSLRLF